MSQAGSRSSTPTVEVVSRAAEPKEEVAFIPVAPSPADVGSEGNVDGADAPPPAKVKKNRSKRWDPVTLGDLTQPETTLAVTRLPPGAEIVFYPHSMKRMYTAPSDMLLITRGLIDYVLEFNQHGPSKTKTKLYSCTMYLQTGACSNGFACREVHFVRDEGLEPGAMSAAIRVNDVHHRDVPQDTYATLPAGHHIPLSLPNMSHSSEPFPTERIFVTKGVQEYFDEMLVGQPTMNMQHCAHFAKNGMCCFGPDCRFVHVANFSIEPQSDSHSDSGSARSSSKSSYRSSSSGSGRGVERHGSGLGGSKNTPLSLEDHQRGMWGANRRGGGVVGVAGTFGSGRGGRFGAGAYNSNSGRDSGSSPDSSLSSLPSVGSQGTAPWVPTVAMQPPAFVTHPALPGGVIGGFAQPHVAANGVAQPQNAIHFAHPQQFVQAPIAQLPPGWTPMGAAPPQVQHHPHQQQQQQQQQPVYVIVAPGQPGQMPQQYFAMQPPPQHQQHQQQQPGNGQFVMQPQMGYGAPGAPGQPQYVTMFAPPQQQQGHPQQVVMGGMQPPQQVMPFPAVQHQQQPINLPQFGSQHHQHPPQQPPPQQQQRWN